MLEDVYSACLHGDEARTSSPVHTVLLHSRQPVRVMPAARQA